MTIEEKLRTELLTVCTKVYPLVCTDVDLPQSYIVITPVADNAELYAGDSVEGASAQYRASWYTKTGNQGKKAQLITAMENAGLLYLSTSYDYDSSGKFYVCRVEGIIDTDL